jgi:ketosteroid isomerase-like protein
MATAPTTRGTYQALKSAMESRDADAVLALYDDDAVLVRYNKATPPAAPLQVTGKEQLATGFRDVFSRDLTHSLGNEVVSDDRISFTVECEYGTGERVMVSSVCDLRDGKVVHQIDVEAYDE